MKILAILGLTLFLGQAAFAQSDLDKEKELSAKYLKEMAKEDGATVTTAGVVIRPIFRSDSTTIPSVGDTVLVTYHLSDREGNVIEESLTNDQIAAFPLSRLIRCWKIAVPQMPVGSLYKVSCPSDTAYGDDGTDDGSIKGGAALTFRIGLFGIQAKAD